MSASLLDAIALYAKAARASLAPEWRDGLRTQVLEENADALSKVCTHLGWRAPTHIAGRPRPDQFPLLVYDPRHSWRVVLQWMNEEELQCAGQAEPLQWHDELHAFLLEIPDPLARGGVKAIEVFTRAVAKRSRVLVLAGLATVFANILTLATSLYAMQLYDRVIPLASFETLFVLTAGVVFALILDFSLRSLRALLIEIEAQNIDKEVSEFFFARAQAIRLDARPQGVGTMAAQIQGQEQVRQVLSSSSLFVLADLPFAIFFLLVISAIGGTIALVPMVSLPLAILLAWGLARIIRSGAERAQVNGNQKTGLMVEMLDSSETVKANSGGWHLLARWNRLIRDVHNFETPVKRAQAVSGSLFSSLQQATYVAVMGYGAYLAANGEITTGGLLACSIIVGRINGPLVAQLPNLIVQWGYARSSLKALDSLLQLPIERTSSGGGLRPGALRGEIALHEARFVYAMGPPVLDVEALHIKPGERVAVIGGVGAGKSTLLKLMAGLYSPTEGTLTLNGIDVGQIADDIARRHLGYLSQNARLVRGTLRDNLTMGLGEVSDDTVIELARQTGLDDLLAGQSDGLDMEIHEGGVGLSGGQRTLVGINRMIHAKPAIWLLDEPTAALDGSSESSVLDALDKAIGPEDIVVMATHKIALLERFSRVVILARGKIVKDAPAGDIAREMAQLSGANSNNSKPRDGGDVMHTAGFVTTTLEGKRAKTGERKT